MTVPVLASSTGYVLQAQSSPDLTAWQSDFTLTHTAPAANGSVLHTWEKTTGPGDVHYYMRLKAVPQ